MLEPPLVRLPLVPLERTLELRAQLLVPPGRLEQRFRSAPWPLAVQPLEMRLERPVEGLPRKTLGRRLVLLDSRRRLERLEQLELPRLWPLCRLEP